MAKEANRIHLAKEAQAFALAKLNKTNLTKIVLPICSHNNPQEINKIVTYVVNHFETNMLKAEIANLSSDGSAIRRKLFNEMRRDLCESLAGLQFLK